MTLESWLYGNPETVAIRRQEEALRKARACGACVHRRTMEIEGQTLNACEYRRQYGRRCDKFETTKGTL